MKKIIIFAIGIIVITAGSIILANNVSKRETNVTKKITNVGLVLNGSKEDRSWGQSHSEGMEVTSQDLNLNLIYREYCPEDERCGQVIEDLIKNDCKILVIDSFGYGQYAYELSKKYPEVYFFHATGLNEGRNFISYFGRIYQMRYLSGIVAGLQTRTNKIGYVAAMPISEVNRGINAFTLGVRSVNPKAKVYVSWSNTWGEYKPTEAATNKLLKLQPEVDILAMHTDSQAVLKIAEEREIWTIGYNIDNSSLYPKTFLTAPIWHWDVFYGQKILECLQGKFKGGHFWYDSDSGIMDLSPLTWNVKPGTAEIVEKEKAALENKVKDVFFGPIYDNQGNLRVPEEENMSDDELLNSFDWYVEGVYIVE